MVALKKHYVLAIVAYVLIPVVTVLGGIAFSLIDPEIAAGHADYARNFHLLMLVKHLILGAAMLVNVLLWLLTCIFLLKARKRSWRWLLLAVSGPFGFILLTMHNCFQLSRLAP